MIRVKLILPLFFLLLLAGCSNTLLIERSESFITNKASTKKIICIDPRFYFEQNSLNYNLEEVGEITQSIKKDIVKFSKKNKLELELFDIHTKTTNSYYDDLLRLKNNMVAANFNQKTPLNFNLKLEENKIHQKVFVYPPKIAHDFNLFSKTYGTPYFSYIGIYIVKEKIVLYHIVVDTDQAETIYREYKTIHKKVNKAIIAQMIYDSFATLAAQMKN